MKRNFEDEFCNALKKIAGDRNVTMSELASDIDAQRQNGKHLYLRSDCSYWNIIVARQRNRATKCSTNNRRQPRLYFRKRDFRYLFLLRQCLAADGEGHCGYCGLSSDARFSLAAYSSRRFSKVSRDFGCNDSRVCA